MLKMLLGFPDLRPHSDEFLRALCSPRRRHIWSLCSYSVVIIRTARRADRLTDYWLRSFSAALQSNQTTAYTVKPRRISPPFLKNVLLVTFKVVQKYKTAVKRREQANSAFFTFRRAKFLITTWLGPGEGNHTTCQGSEKWLTSLIKTAWLSCKKAKCDSFSVSTINLPSDYSAFCIFLLPRSFEAFFFKVLYFFLTACHFQP